MHFVVDYWYSRCYMQSILAHSGRVLEAYLNTERGVASRGGDSQPPPREARDPARRTRGARCDRSGSDSGEGSAGPEPKIATVERREAGVPRMGTQGASLGAWPARVMGRPNGCLASTRRLSALRHPVNSGERSQKRKTRAQKTRRGNEETCAV